MDTILDRTTIDEDTEGDMERAEAIRDALRHAWQGYERYAFGADELQPVSAKGLDNFGGLGATIIDSLDTLWMLGFRDEFARYVGWWVVGVVCVCGLCVCFVSLLGVRSMVL